VNGSIQVYPRNSTTYILTATGPEGTTRAEVRITSYAEAGGSFGFLIL